MSSEGEVIETPWVTVAITIVPDELIPGRCEARARVIAAGLSDEDIERLIKQAQREVEPRAE